MSHENLPFTTEHPSSRDAKLDTYYNAAEQAGIPHSRIHQFTPHSPLFQQTVAHLQTEATVPALEEASALAE